MADEPSIDEILASLDRLLKEGEGRNDEPEELPSPAAEPLSPTSHDAPTPHFFEVLDEEAEGSHGDSGPDGIGSDTDIGGVMAADEEATDDGDVGEAAEAHAEGNSKLFVLTDAMRIDDQPSLPLGMGGETAETEESMQQALGMPEESDEPEAEDPGFATSELEPAEGAEPESAFDMASEISMEPETVFMSESEVLPPEAADERQPEFAEETEPEAFTEEAVAVTWDEAGFQALVDQVTDDVCSAVAEQLPELIRRALDERLSAFIDARTKHQDTGSQE